MDVTKYLRSNPVISQMRNYHLRDGKQLMQCREYVNTLTGYKSPVSLPSILSLLVFLTYLWFPQHFTDPCIMIQSTPSPTCYLSCDSRSFLFLLYKFFFFWDSIFPKSRLSLNSGSSCLLLPAFFIRSLYTGSLSQVFFAVSISQNNWI